MGKPYASEMRKLKSTYEWALEAPVESLSEFVEYSLDLPMMCVGSGGSLTVAKMVGLLHEKAGAISKSITPLQLLSTMSSLRRSSILLITAGGRNSDIQAAFKFSAMSEPRHLMALCARKNSPISKLSRRFRFSRLLDFDIPSGKDGFLATNSLIAMLTLVYRAYERVQALPPLQDADLLSDEELNVDLCDLDFLKKRRTWIVLHERWSSPAASDLESKFSEAALGRVQNVDYRNFAHGRHYWLERCADETGVIGFITPEDMVSSRTLALIPEDVPVVKITTDFEDATGALQLVAKAMHFVETVGDLMGVDPGRPRVPSFGRRIYHLRPKLRFNEEYTKGNLRRKDIVPILRKLGEIKSREYVNWVFWKNALERFLSRLKKAIFGGLVFNYDGTLCDFHERFKGPSRDIVDRLTPLLEEDIIVGVATGRGKSAGNDLRRLLPKQNWGKIFVGYYNGSDIAALEDKRRPNKRAKKSAELTRVAEFLNEDDFFALMAEWDIRPKQISIIPRTASSRSQLRRRVTSAFSGKEFKDVRILESSHSFDIIPSSVSKKDLVSVVEKSLTDRRSPKSILCIGDMGDWPGNDYELLACPYSLSVDRVSNDPDSCWNLAPAGHRGVQATMDYVDSLHIRKGLFRLNPRSIGVKGNER